MRFSNRLLRLVCALVPTCLLLLSGCSKASNTGPMGQPITVSLPNPKVIVSKDGTPTIAEISIMSTSETAVVAFSGLPGGVQVNYSASDTNPSGDLRFTAGENTPLGTSMPKVNVQSAGQMASTTFTLTVTK